MDQFLCLTRQIFTIQAWICVDFIPMEVVEVGRRPKQIVIWWLFLDKYHGNGWWHWKYKTQQTCLVRKFWYFFLIHNRNSNQIGIGSLDLWKSWIQNNFKINYLQLLTETVFVCQLTSCVYGTGHRRPAVDCLFTFENDWDELRLSGDGYTEILRH